MNDPQPPQLSWEKFLSEFVGTAILLFLGLSLVIAMYGAGSPVATIVPDLRQRMVISGFLFGAIGASIALSPVGKVSGAHVNPVVTLGFWLFGKMSSLEAAGFVLAQLSGGVAGSVPLLAWGVMGRSIDFGATTPGQGYSVAAALVGEVATTFALISALCVFIGVRPLRKYTPFMIPFLYAIMCPLEAPISGISTNPARSFGPSVISGQWTEWWIYWAGPIVGTVAAIALFRFVGVRVEEARLYYFESDLRHRPLRPSAPARAART